jgi:hypothetical protein
MEREELDIKIKELQAKAEAFFAIAGKEPLEVYRIEKFEPVKQETQFHGKFYDGDSYVVLKQNDKDYDIHYWHGKDSSMVSVFRAKLEIGRTSNQRSLHCAAVRKPEVPFSSSPRADDGGKPRVPVLLQGWNLLPRGRC